MEIGPMSEESKPKMTVQKAVINLSAHRQEWESLLQFLSEEREQFFADQRQAESPHDVMKLAGSIATITELAGTLTPEGWT